MNKLWIVLAGIFAFIFIGFVFIVVSLFAFLIAGSFGSQDVSTSGIGNVALIPIKGELVTESASFLPGTETSSHDLVKLIEKADKDDFIEGIIFEINSPGGSAIASDEVAEAIKAVKKPNVAWIREEGASGAYWIATSTDYIVANRMSIVGSIGVTASYLRLGGLLNKYNITYERMVSGRLKDEGSPFRDATPEEKEKLQAILDKIHSEFIEQVADGRNMSRQSVERIATGEVFLGMDAKEIGLVDELGGKAEAIKYLEEKLERKASIVEYKKKRSILDSFSETMSGQFFYLGKGIGSSFSAKAFEVKT